MRRRGRFVSTRRPGCQDNRGVRTFANVAVFSSARVSLLGCFMHLNLCCVTFLGAKVLEFGIVAVIKWFKADFAPGFASAVCSCKLLNAREKECARMETLKCPMAFPTVASLRGGCQGKVSTKLPGRGKG